MKYALIAAGLLLAAPALAQQSYNGPETAAPAKWASSIVLHTTDSAGVAYTKAVRAVLTAGYGIDKSDKDALFLSTPPRATDGKTFLLMQLAAAPAPGGSVVTFRGVYTWLTATTIMAHVENRQLPVQYVGRGNSPTQRMWEELQRVALLAAPGATVGYK